MKWSLFNWKKPVVSSGEPEDYQVVKNTVSQNERNITTINNQLANTVSTNTAQTITGAKTFNEGITINKNPIPLLLKATSSEKNYVVFRDSANNSNLSIGANATSSSLEVNRGNLEIQTQQDNKNISFNTGRVKFNRSVVEFGTEINAGYGGGIVKFIPEDNSTKTLQFFNSSATDNRRFNLLVPEPTQNNNPATKNYVDTKETAINNQINTLNTFKTTTETNISNINNSITELNDFKNNANGIGLNLRYQDLQLRNSWIGTEVMGQAQVFKFRISTLQETKFMSATLHLKGQTNGEEKATHLVFSSATTWGPKIYFNIIQIERNDSLAPDFDNTFIRIFYIDTLDSRTQDPYFLEAWNEN